MSKDLIVDRKYLSYVKAINYYDSKSYLSIKKEETIPIGEFSNVRDLNLLIFLLSRKFLTTNKNSFSLNLSSPEELCIGASFRAWLPIKKKKLLILYDTYQGKVNLTNYNSGVSFECSGSYFQYLADSENKNIILEVHKIVQRAVKRSITKLKDYE